MKKKTSSSKRLRLKKHHKVILMSALGVFAFSIPFIGTLHSQTNATSSGTRWPCGTSSTTPCPTPYPYPRITQLTCSMCTTKVLCFSKSQKRAFCQNPSLGIAQPADAICVSCQSTITPTIYPKPSCGPYRYTGQTNQNTQVPCY